MPVTVAQFFDQLRESEVLPREEVETLWKRIARDDRQAPAERLTRKLVNSGQLTEYQAAALLDGQGRTLVLGEYLILDKLGEGGMGQVLKAIHRRMRRQVAIKVLAKAVTQRPESVRRFQREVLAAAKLSHPNIVAAHDAGEQKGIHFLVMEYVSGNDLAQVVRQTGPLSVDLALDCIAQAALGLAHAHQHGIIHRDIKPANLLLDAQGVLKILDMGIARFDGQIAEEPVTGLTGTGTMMGTIDYMSPEQALDAKSAGVPADVYSLGCTLFYLLTGRVVYEGETMMKRLVGHRESPIPSLSAARSEVPPALPAIFAKMVAKRPDDRYQSVTQVREEIELCRNVLARSNSIHRVEGAPRPIPRIAAPADGIRSMPATFAEAPPLPPPLPDNPRTVPVADASLFTNPFPPPPAPSAWKPSLSMDEARHQRFLHIAMYAAAAVAALTVSILLLAGFGAFSGAGKDEPSDSQANSQPSGQPQTPNESPTSSQPSPHDPASRGRNSPIDPPTVSPVAANESRVEVERTRVVFLVVMNHLPESLRPAEVADALAKWEAAEAALQAKDYSTAQDGFKAALPVFTSAVAKARQTRALLDTAQSRLSELAARREKSHKSWQALPPDKQPKSAADAEAAFAAAEESAERLDALALVPERVNEAIEHFDKADAEYLAMLAVATPKPGDVIENSLKMKLVYIPPGEFDMGSPKSEKDRGTDEKLHHVRLIRGFYLGKYEVTQQEYEQVMGKNPSSFSATGSGKADVQKLNTSRFPVEMVNWEDATEFCRKLSAREGKTYRLPTEAEWEYACRAGSQGNWCFGNDEKRLVDYAWWGGRETHAVGEKTPNAFGIHDMHGNVSEWCADWYGEYAGDAIDPQALVPTNPHHVFRGGCWYSSPLKCRSAVRGWGFGRGRDLGFRVACNVDSRPRDLGLFAWSKIVTPSVIEHEVLTIVLALDKDITTPTDFATKGYELARKHFTMLAVLFAVAGEYDGEVGFKKDAPALRDLMAYNASIAKIGTESVYKEAKLCQTSLQDIVGGLGFTGTTTSPFRADWKNVCGRPPLMNRLEVAFQRNLQPWLSTKDEFSRNRKQVSHEAQIVAVLAEVLGKDGMDDAVNDEYKGFTIQLKTAALEIVDAVKLDGYEKARAAVVNIGQVCSKCHAGFRG